MITKTLYKLFSLEDKVILATGAAGAIGSAIAKCYANLGAKVIIADFNEEAMAEVEKEIKADGGECTCMKLELPKEDSINEVVDATIAKYGRIDVLANIAGIRHRRCTAAQTYRRTHQKPAELPFPAYPPDIPDGSWQYGPA